MTRKRSASTDQRVATNESFRLFARDELIGEPGAFARASEVYATYLRWYDGMYEHGLIEKMDRAEYGIEFDLPVWERASITLFGVETAKFLPKRVRNAGTYYIGVRLRTSEDPPLDFVA